MLWNNGADDEKIAMAVVGVSGAKRWSYGALRETVLRTASGLIESGLRPGDRLLLRLGNSADFPIVFLAAVSAGILPIPTSDMLTNDEVAKLIRVVEPKAIAGRGSGFLDPDVLRTSRPLKAPILGPPERPAYIIFTSGTSGKPMGVVHAHRAIWARRAMITGWYGLTADDRMMHAGAFNWTYTLGTGLMDPWSVGATAVVPEAGTDIAALPLLMKRHDASIFAAAPGVFRRLLRDELPSLPKLRHALSAGEKLPEPIAKKWREATSTDVHEAFGQSECSTFISGGPERPAKPGSLGFGQPGRRIAILNDDGPVKRGEPGQIAVDRNDPGVMLEYWRDAEATKAKFQGDWFLTGDMGEMDDAGAITYLGRRDDILTAGGYRISPVEVEEAMIRHAGITDAAAVDEHLGTDTTIVALHYAAETQISEADLRAHANQYLASYKQPRRFHHHSSLPRGAGGKLLRARLRTRNGT
ncbi:MAG: AMP-binding protein [Boseongicola sp.]|nr:AMP-binding protein [Boseongicola sp.]